MDDYEDEDVYETVIKYKTVMRDIFEQRTEKIEKFSVETSVIQTGLVSKLRRSLDEGIESALGYASEQIETMKNQFTEMFDELDMLIQKKYTELEKCAKDQALNKKELQYNKKILDWIESCKSEMDDILDI